MSSTETPQLPAISIDDERRRVRAMRNHSIQRLAGALWLVWLEHLARCQTDGMSMPTEACPNHYGSIGAQDALYPDGWDCCPLHRELKAERDKLIAFAESRSYLMTAPHQPQKVFSPEWWQFFGFRYNGVKRPVKPASPPKRPQSR